ncbi:hypothetical protein GF339_09785, partial [candidate division KSB3 bacterium]|nr:hypothetical protein [candidate division KSB3 bacterium]
MDAPLKQVDEHTDADAYLEYPPDLEQYLPPALWRRLSSGKPQRELLVQANVRLRSLLY